MTRADPLHPHKTPTSAATKAATILVATLLTLSLWWLLTALLQQLGALSRPLQPPDDTRLALWLGVSLLLLCWAPARRVGTGLVARFDSVLLRPPNSVDLTALAASDPSSKKLRDWCFDGVGNGAAPLLLPNAMPAMPHPISVCVWELDPTAQRTDPSRQLNAFMCQLDGTGLLLACKGPWAGRWLRLLIKLREALWWRARPEDAPWDCGFLNADDAAVAQFKDFCPRRPTLIVAQDIPTQVLRDGVKSWQEQPLTFRHPVRLLVLDSFEMDDGLPVLRLQDPP